MEGLSDDALLGLFHHELNHWVKHPYDAKTILLEHSWLEGRRNRRLIRNLFDDVVVNIDLVVNKGLEEVSKLYEEIKAVTRVDNLIRALLSKLTGLSFGRYKLDGDLKERLRRLLEIDYLDTTRIRLKNNIRRFADVIEDILDDYTMPLTNFDIGDFPEGEIRRAVMEIAREMEMEDFKRFTRDLARSGIGKMEGELKDPDLEWYKARAMNYTVRIRPLMKTGSLYPLEIKDFELESGMDRYNPVESYGRFIPGIAKEFKMEDFEGLSESVPDAVIIIDSSGSMRDPEKTVSYAVLGAFAIARSYMESGAKVGVVNFSGRNIKLYPTRGDEVYRYIKIYQGGGTVLNVKDLEEYVKRVGEADYILITDAGLYNVEEVVEFFSKMKYRLTLIWIKSDVKGQEEFRKRFEKLRGIRNVNVIEVEREEDIPRIAISHVGEVSGWT